MKIIAPDYYKKFRCIADKCAHSCCIGWEIDIDEDTAEYYKSIKGVLGERLSECVDFSEPPHFKLGEDERCPFLNKNGLCDIISELGEGALCQICSDHPRFRNYYDNVTEIGLGLCCEAAAKLILDNKEKVSFVEIQNDGTEMDSDSEIEFFCFRNGIFDILQDRSLGFNERMAELLNTYSISFANNSLEYWKIVYSDLERLDNSWGDMLSILTDNFKCSLSDTVLEQLSVYFVYRHLADGLYDGKIKERIAFCILSVNIIRALCSVCSESVYEIARMYSSEVEYSEENIDALLNILGGV